MQPRFKGFSQSRYESPEYYCGGWYNVTQDLPLAASVTAAAFYLDCPGFQGAMPTGVEVDGKPEGKGRGPIDD